MIGVFSSLRISLEQFLLLDATSYLFDGYEIHLILTFNERHHFPPPFFFKEEQKPSKPLICMMWDNNRGHLYLFVS